MIFMQQGDVKLYQTNDGGEITVENGITEMSSGLETCAYLALFGGNEKDAGGADLSKTWWGNFDESNQSGQYRAEFQNLIQSIQATKPVTHFGGPSLISVFRAIGCSIIKQYCNLCTACKPHLA